MTKLCGGAADPTKCGGKREAPPAPGATSTRLHVLVLYCLVVLLALATSVSFWVSFSQIAALRRDFTGEIVPRGAADFGPPSWYHHGYADLEDEEDDEDVEDTDDNVTAPVGASPVRSPLDMDTQSHGREKRHAASHGYEVLDTPSHGDDDDNLIRVKRRADKRKRSRKRNTKERDRRPPAFFYEGGSEGDRNGEGSGSPADHHVWLTSYSRIPVFALQEFCAATREYCPPGQPGPQGLAGGKGDRGERGAPGEVGPAGEDGRPGPTGEKGVSGSAGDMGSKGEIGPPGLAGSPGEDGLDGLPALDGLPGQKGDLGNNNAYGPPTDPSNNPGQSCIQCPPGAPGLPGPEGPSGQHGPLGPPGLDGLPGESGVNGTEGEKGKRGKRGQDGDPGPPGEEGPRGPKGDTGDQGSDVNCTCEKGEKGDIGSKGDAGRDGKKGQRGLIGFLGYKGDPGPPGDIGIPGDAGPPGPYATGPPGPSGAQGPTGHKGQKGETGHRFISGQNMLLDTTIGTTTTTTPVPTTPVVTTPEPTIDPRTASCGIRMVGKPLFQRYTGTYWGAWMKDTFRNTAPDVDKFWFTRHFTGKTLYEYADQDEFRANRQSHVYSLDDLYFGTGHVVYDGHFYYHKSGTRELVKYSLERETAVGTLHVPEAAFQGKDYVYSTEYNYFDLATDANGLWAIYNQEGEGQHLLVSKVNTVSMEIEKTWNISVNHRGYGNGFVTCGVLYLIHNTNTKTTLIDFAYDMYTKTELRNVRLQFTNPFEMNNMISYNHLDRKIYSWDKGNQLTYPLLLKY